MADLIGHLFARRSMGWTFRTLFLAFFCAKVHVLDLQDRGGYPFPLPPSTQAPSCPTLSPHAGLDPGSPAAGPLSPSWTPSVKICL